MPSATADASAAGRAGRGRAIGHRAGALLRSGRSGRSGRLPALLVTLAGLLLLYGLLLSGDYVVASVVVEGARIGNPQEIAATSRAFGQPIFELNPDDAARRVARLPYVETASVRASFPDKVEIVVVERVPVVTWQVNGQAFLVDARGNVLLAGRAPDLPSAVVEGDTPVVGGAVDQARVATVVAVREALGDRLDELRWTASDGLIAQLANGRVVVFGDAERIPRKLAVLETVASSPASWSVLDLREPDRPYYK
jgi:cell division protein FtsQ